MIETITPAVCGSRNRRRVAVVAFAAGALAASALLGAALGALGAALGGGRSIVLAVAVLAVLAMLREAGLLRLPVPQARRQVPERWQRELPLPVWAAGYGAGLGIGVATFQPVATFWIACGAAVALADPVAAALCLSFYGAGRTLTLVWPRRSGEDETAAVERLVSRRRAVRRANVAALAICAGLLAAAPAGAATALDLGPGSELDPAVWGSTLAYTQRSGGTSQVLVGPRSSPLSYEGESPALDGERLAYRDAAGIRVIRWRTDEEIWRVDGAVSAPALAWPWLAYRASVSGRKRLVLRNLDTGGGRVVTSVPASTDLGRPTLRAGRLAWHTTDARSSRIVLYSLSAGKRRLVAASKIALHSNPALSRRFILWIEQRAGRLSVRLRPISGRRVRTLESLPGRGRSSYWTTALSPPRAYYTRWIVRTGSSSIVKRSFTP